MRRTNERAERLRREVERRGDELAHAEARLREAEEANQELATELAEERTLHQTTLAKLEAAEKERDEAHLALEGRGMATVSKVLKEKRGQEAQLEAANRLAEAVTAQGHHLMHQGQPENCRVCHALATFHSLTRETG